MGRRKGSTNKETAAKRLLVRFLVEEHVGKLVPIAAALGGVSRQRASQLIAEAGASERAAALREIEAKWADALSVRPDGPDEVCRTCGGGFRNQNPLVLTCCAECSKAMIRKKSLLRMRLWREKNQTKKDG